MSELTIPEISKIIKDNTPYRVLEVRLADETKGDDPNYIYAAIAPYAGKLAHLRYAFAISKENMAKAIDPKPIILEQLQIANTDLGDIERSGTVPANLLLWG